MHTGLPVGVHSNQETETETETEASPSIPCEEKEEDGGYPTSVSSCPPTASFFCTASFYADVRSLLMDAVTFRPDVLEPGFAGT